MADSISPARDYVDKFYAHQKANMDALYEGTDQGANNFRDIMSEPNPRDLGNEIGIELMSLAVSCIPGFFFLSETWQVTVKGAQATKLYAANWEFLAARGVDVGKSIAKVAGAKGAVTARPYSKTKSAMIRRIMDPIYRNLDAGRVRLQNENDWARDDLVYQMDQPEMQKWWKLKSTLEAARKILGPVPPITTPDQVAALALNIEALLFKAYTKFKPVVLVKTVVSNMGGYSLPKAADLDSPNAYRLASGFNTTQEDYVMTSFRDLNEKIGPIKNAKDLQKWGATVSTSNLPYPAGTGF